MDGLSLAGSITEADRETIKAFRLRVADINYNPLKDDVYAARWLKARNWDVDKAEKMFRASFAWKMETKIDEILSTFNPPEALKNYFPGGVCGHDKHGRPIFICPAGTADVFGLMKSASRSQLANFQYYMMELIVNNHFPTLSASFNQPVDQLVVIFDLQHMNRRQLWRPWLTFVQELTAIFELNYPEVMAVSYVINAPSFFSLVFALLKPLLSKETQAKVYVLGSNYTEELLNMIEAENLPACYGGSMVDPDGDPRCPSKICWGGVVPEHYYIQQPVRVDGGGLGGEAVIDDTYILVSIGRGSKETVTIGDAKPGDIVSWEFFTESNDIAFGLWVDPGESDNSGTRSTSASTNGYENVLTSPAQEFRGWLKNGVLKLNSQKFSESEKSQTNVMSSLSLLTGAIPKSWRQITQFVRVDCDLVPEVGQRKAEVEGCYHLVFDNTYSWTRSKRLWCRVETTCTTNSNTNFTKIAKSNPSNAGSDVASMPTEKICRGNTEEIQKVSTVCSVEDSEIELGLDDILREISHASVNDSPSQCLLNMDVDFSVLMRVFLQTLPLIRRGSRFKLP